MNNSLSISPYQSARVPVQPQAIYALILWKQVTLFHTQETAFPSGLKEIEMFKDICF